MRRRHGDRLEATRCRAGLCAPTSDPPALTAKTSATTSGVLRQVGSSCTGCLGRDEYFVGAWWYLAVVEGHRLGFESHFPKGC